MINKNAAITKEQEGEKKKCWVRRKIVLKLVLQQ